MLWNLKWVELLRSKISRLFWLTLQQHMQTKHQKEATIVCEKKDFQAVLFCVLSHKFMNHIFLPSHYVLTHIFVCATIWFLHELEHIYKSNDLAKLLKILLTGIYWCITCPKDLCTLHSCYIPNNIPLPTFLKDVSTCGLSDINKFSNWILLLMRTTITLFTG